MVKGKMKDIITEDAIKQAICKEFLPAQKEDDPEFNRRSEIFNPLKQGVLYD